MGNSQNKTCHADAAAGSEVRVLVVDDQKAFRSVASLLVDRTGGFALVGEASCGEEVLAAMEKLAPDLVLMDVLMPGMGGIEATRGVLARYPGAVVLLISAIEHPPVPLPADASGRRVRWVAKEQLSPALLREVWQTCQPS